jgi:hypothetical protein
MLQYMRTLEANGDVQRALEVADEYQLGLRAAEKGQQQEGADLALATAYKARFEFLLGLNRRPRPRYARAFIALEDAVRRQASGFTPPPPLAPH